MYGLFIYIWVVLGVNAYIEHLGLVYHFIPYLPTPSPLHVGRCSCCLLCCSLFQGVRSVSLEKPPRKVCSKSLRCSSDEAVESKNIIAFVAVNQDSPQLITNYSNLHKNLNYKGILGGNIPGPSKGCQMDGSRGAIKQPLRVQTPPLGRCWYSPIINHHLIRTNRRIGC